MDDDEEAGEVSHRLASQPEDCRGVNRLSETLRASPCGARSSSSAVDRESVDDSRWRSRSWSAGGVVDPDVSVSVGGEGSSGDLGSFIILFPGGQQNIATDRARMRLLRPVNGHPVPAREFARLGAAVPPIFVPHDDWPSPAAWSGEDRRIRRRDRSRGPRGAEHLSPYTGPRPPFSSEQGVRSVRRVKKPAFVVVRIPGRSPSTPAPEANHLRSLGRRRPG